MARDTITIQGNSEAAKAFKAAPAEEIIEQHPSLGLADVYGAIA